MDNAKPQPGPLLACQRQSRSARLLPADRVPDVFRSVDWNSEAITPPSSVGGGIFLRSASCPGYSWGQNLTDATVGETVTWSYKGQSDKLYLDTKTLGWMFPGLGISLNNGSGAVNYIVTGVYPQLGYISVMNAASNSGTPLVGTKTTFIRARRAARSARHLFRGRLTESRRL